MKIRRILLLEVDRGNFDDCEYKNLEQFTLGENITILTIRDKVIEGEIIDITQTFVTLLKDDDGISSHTIYFDDIVEATNTARLGDRNIRDIK